MKRQGQGKKDFKVVRRDETGRAIESKPLTINQAVSAKLQFDRLGYVSVEIVKFK